MQVSLVGYRTIAFLCPVTNGILQALLTSKLSFLSLKWSKCESMFSANTTLSHTHHTSISILGDKDGEMADFRMWVRAGSHQSQFCLLPIFGEEKIGKNFARAKFWRWSHWTNMFEPKLRWLTYMSCHDIYSQENISRIACARMDRHIQVIIFAAFGLLLNFVFQSQQNNAAFLVL